MAAVRSVSQIPGTAGRRQQTQIKQKEKFMAQEGTGPAFAANSKHVQIKDDKGQVDQDSVRLSKKAGEEVAWSARGVLGATIVFGTPDGSPFEQTIFHVPAGGVVS